MLKSFIDIDIRKVGAICGIVIAFAVPISQDSIPNAPLSIFFAVATVTVVKAIAAIVAWGCGILIGSQGVATLLSPRETPPPTK